ncbi:MAG: type I-E CRISPR-associated protein Cse2/CasB [Thermoanaerobaculia bacterium]|nr:type I-E CRISPR-associated protein Cse2/CasB [Thermoanaerobaculia bacterium]
MAQAPDLADRFVGRLETLRDREERGALAALRRSASEAAGWQPEALAVVYPWLPRTLGPREEDRFLLVASLFALHSLASGSGTLGLSFRRLAAATASESVEKRFLGLLASEEEDLGAHLRHAVTLLAAHAIPVDWRQLLRDLRGWGYETRRVQRRWARDFWGANEEPVNTASPINDIQRS